MARRTTTPRRSNPRPPSLQWLTALTTLVNVLMRLFTMFRGKGGSRTTTSRSDDAGVVPGPAAPTRREAPNTSSRTSDSDRRVNAPLPPRAGKATPAPTTGRDGGIGELFRQQRGDVVVEASGLVVKVLPDDVDTSDGSECHQKFLVELPPADARADAITVRVCHNLKFGRVPVAQGERITFKGEYEWTELGGTIHWTHHDPRGTHEDGYIDHNGRRYG